MSDRMKKIRQNVVGNYLRDARLAAGLTQWDIANLAGYTTAQFVSNWERGMSAPPNEALPILCKALRIGQRELLRVMDSYTDLIAEEQKRLRAQVFKANKAG